MKPARIPGAAGALAVVLASCAAALLAQSPQNRPPLPMEPLGTQGEAIYPALEGWGPHKDGSIVILLGYYNRNRTTLDIPVGPNNRIEPGGPDLGQPTVFEPSRQHGVFAIKVPKDFGNKKYTWTLVANGHTASVSFWTNPAYWVDFFQNPASGNQPPVIKFAPDGPPLSGPPLGVVQTLTTTVEKPVTLRLWASDAPATRKGAEAELAALRGSVTNRSAPPPAAVIGTQVVGGTPAGRGGGGGGGPAPDIVVNWRRHRAPGNVSFTPERIPLQTKGDHSLFLEAVTTAKFDAPGEYVLRAQVNDESGDGGGGDQCCWTTAHVKVTVK
jgi:hypothetical protein